MVSGFVTSPEDQSRICLLEASPIRIASKSLMSIKFSPQSLLVFELEVNEVCVAERTDFGIGLLGGFLSLRHLDVVEVDERLVGRQRDLAVLVDALLALFRLLRRRLAADRAQGAGREIDAELLGRAQEL